jgi:hypothetical protein
METAKQIRITLLIGNDILVSLIYYWHINLNKLHNTHQSIHFKKLEKYTVYISFYLVTSTPYEKPFKNSS